MNKVLLSVKINAETYEKLKEHKKRNGVPITFTIDQAVNEYFENHNLSIKRKGK